MPTRVTNCYSKRSPKLRLLGLFSACHFKILSALNQDSHRFLHIFDTSLQKLRGMLDGDDDAILDRMGLAHDFTQGDGLVMEYRTGGRPPQSHHHQRPGLGDVLRCSLGGLFLKTRTQQHFVNETTCEAKVDGGVIADQEDFQEGFLQKFS